MFNQHGFANRGTGSSQSFSASPFASIANSSTTSSSPFGAIGNSKGNFGPFGTQNNPFTAAASTSKSGGSFSQHGFGQSAQTAPNLFNSSANASPFGSSATSSASPFGSSVVTTNPFASAGPTGFKGFGTPAQGSNNSFSFGNTQKNQFPAVQANKGSSPFGFANSGANSGFGSANTKSATVGSSPFGNISANASSVPSFGNNSVNNSTGASQFGNNNSSSSFSNSTATNTKSVFGFGAQSTNNNAFGMQNQGANTFQNKPTNSNNVRADQSQGPYGGNAANNGTPSELNNTANNMVRFKQAPADEKQTQLKSLSDDIIGYFKADHFDLGKVPDVPPPLEMC